MDSQNTKLFPEIEEVYTVGNGDGHGELQPVMDYLRRFGYISSNKLQPEFRGTSTSEALARYQEFYGLDATGIFDEATKRQMMRPRCGVPDFFNLYRGESIAKQCRWRERNTLFYCFDSFSAERDKQDIILHIEAAFATWQDEGLVPMEFKRVDSDGENVDIRIGWDLPTGAGDQFGEKGLAYADFPGSCAELNIPYKPIRFRADQRWVMEEFELYDIQAVALHEIGHVLGLTHSEEARDVMHPNTFNLRKLSPGDKARIASLYSPGATV